MIVYGLKFWEMRSRITTIRKRVGIIKAETGLIINKVELIDCLTRVSSPQTKFFKQYSWLVESQIKPRLGFNTVHGERPTVQYTLNKKHDPLDFTIPSEN